LEHWLSPVLVAGSSPSVRLGISFGQNVSLSYTQLLNL
jgi:hypothetical protein